MGPMSFRTYHDVEGEDRSQLLAQVVAQRERVGRRLASVRRVVAVMSGKGLATARKSKTPPKT